MRSISAAKYSASVSIKEILSEQAPAKSAGSDNFPPYKYSLGYSSISGIIKIEYPLLYPRPSLLVVKEGGGFFILSLYIIQRSRTGMRV